MPRPPSVSSQPSASARRLAIGITGNQQDAEEAVQDAFWSVVRNIDAFRGVLRGDRGSTESP
jgi:DNA-directed RNA polymerase specialized sigma24 family protein